MNIKDFEVPAEKVKVEEVEGKTGTGLKLAFADECSGVFVRGRATVNGFFPNTDWDKAAGFSFWVKGDGSNHLGGIEFVWNSDYDARYGYAFPINETGWRKIVVPWRDLVPEVLTTLQPIDATKGTAPSKLSPVAFGKWWYWGDYAAHSYTISDFRLEPKIALDTKEYRPADAPLARVVAKLQAGKPVSIVTMGDSLTDTRHWANRETNWPAMLQAQLKAKYGSEIKIVNPAVGGTALLHNLVTLPRWTSVEPQPDLVTVFFGGNDHASGMRGGDFLRVQKDTVDRIRRATHGKSDVLILTTCPSLENGDLYSELAAACRQAARDKKAGLSDIYGAVDVLPMTEREKVFAWDKVHLAPGGHDLVTQMVLQAIEEQPVMAPINNTPE